MKRRMKMSNFTWSKNQLDAISYIDSNVLVSAGAGSGKTAVLTERIYQLVKNGADLSRFLVLTFTNAASAEMKQRIRKRVEEDPELRHLSYKIESSHIETFDAFALFLVKKYAFRLGVSPNISLIDNTLLEIQKAKIRDRNITYLYNSKDSYFLDLISTYCVKNDSQIREFISKVCSFVELKNNKYDYISSFVQRYFNETKIQALIDEKYNSMINAIEIAIKQAEQLENLDDANNIISYLEDLLEHSNSYDLLVLNLENYNFPKMIGKGSSDKDYRDYIKSTLNKNLSIGKPFGTSEEIINQYLGTKKHVETILKIVEEIERQIDLFKKEKNAYSFSDIANLALKLLDDEQICSEMRDYFQYILVDEYQDTSALQELVINKLSKNNVCMVGDVKQSIYRFRFADCSIFQEKYQRFQLDDGGHLICLNTSYRSRKEIVDAVNDIFERLMTHDINPINYKDGHHFEYGFTFYDSHKEDKQEYGLKVYRYLLDENETTNEKEAHIIANDIINKINNKMKVYDPKIKGLRECTFKDFAIIIDRGKNFDEIKSIFFGYGIPTKVFYDQPVKTSDVVLVLKNLVVLYKNCFDKTFDDPTFIHSFVSIARSFLFEYEDEYIYQSIKNKNINNDLIIRKMIETVDKSKELPLSEKLKTIINEFEIYDRISRLGNYINNTNRIELFINLSKSMEELGFELYDLVQYFEDLNDFDLDIPYVDSDVSEDSVSLMTIHRSKGLEYPVIYLPGLTSKFPGGGSNSAFMINDNYGMILPLTGVTSNSSLFNHLIKQEESKANFEERLRLLYVAITRAREHAILLYQDKEKGDSPVIDPSNASSYRSLIHYLGLEDTYSAPYHLSKDLLGTSEKANKDIHIVSKEVSIVPEEIISRKASKNKDENVNEDLLRFGTEIHYLLEIFDFDSKDFSYIKDEKMKKYVRNVTSTKIFENVKNNQVLHEYQFKDDLNNVSGIIDCLVVKDDEIDIVDFKLKKLDDEKYVLQLHSYSDYIKQITSKKIKMYLVSAITGEVKEIE